MNAVTQRQFLLCFLALAFAAALLAGGFVHAQGAHFKDRARIELAMDNAPGAVVTALEGILSQEQIDAIEAALLPPPTDAEKKEALESAKTRLLRAGFSADDPIVAAVTARVNGLAPATTAGSVEE